MKKRFFLIIFIVATIGLFVFAHVVLQHNAKYEPQTNLNAPIEVPDENIVTIQEAYKIEKPIVAMFYVDWCSYCRKFMPTYGNLAKQYQGKYTFAVINADTPENIKMAEKFHVIGFPSLFLIDKKINHKFSLNIAGTSNTEIFKEELDNYLTVRKALY